MVATTSVTDSHPPRPAAGTDPLIERVSRLLAAAGTSMTPFRRIVLQEIANSRQPLGAYNLADRISLQLSKRVAPNSIYRVLELFCELGIVRRVESLHAFCLVTGDDASAVLLMCDDCGGIQAVGSGEVHDAVSRQIEAAGFHPNRQVIEVAGRCQSCDNSE